MKEKGLARKAINNNEIKAGQIFGFHKIQG
jgi:hypothetical protein